MCLRYLNEIARLLLLLFSAFFTQIAHATPPQIIVAYPPSPKTVAFDHVMLNGSVSRGASLQINNRVLDAAPDGLFIEWWPLQIGENVLHFQSALNGETSRRELRVTRTVAASPNETTDANATSIVTYLSPRVGVITAQAVGLSVNASTTAIRNGPKRSHVLQLQAGEKFVVIGEDGETFRCALSSTQTVNVLKSQMQLLPLGTALTRVYFSRIETRKIATSSTRI